MKRLGLAALACALWCGLGWASPEAEAGGHGESHEGGSILLVAKWVNFAILAGALGYMGVKFGAPALRGQQKGILDSLNAAALRAEASEAEARRIEDKISALDSEVAGLKEKAQRELAAEGGRLERETARAIEKLAASASQELVSAAKFARAELKAEAARLALELAEQKVRARMTAGVEAELVGRFVANLNARPGARG